MDPGCPSVRVQPSLFIRAWDRLLNTLDCIPPRLDSQTPICPRYICSFNLYILVTFSLATYLSSSTLKSSSDSLLSSSNVDSSKFFVPSVRGEVHCFLPMAPLVTGPLWELLSTPPSPLATMGAGLSLALPGGRLEDRRLEQREELAEIYSTNR